MPLHCSAAQSKQSAEDLFFTFMFYAAEWWLCVWVYATAFSAFCEPHISLRKLMDYHLYILRLR